MKKGTIIALIVAATLILTGGIIVILGLSFAGTSQDAVTMLVESEHIVDAPFDSILIDTEDCNVTFVMLSGRADAQVSIRERQSAAHSVLVEDGVLKIKMKDNRTWRDFIGVNWESMEMTVFLPAAEYESVRVYTATGHIQIPQDFTIREAALRSDTGALTCEADVTEDLSCFTATGAITVQNASLADVRLDSGTGRIHVSGVTATQLAMENDTGKTQVENVTCDLVACESETGDVTLRSVLAQEYMQVFTDTGDVFIENSDAGKVNIETDTGDVSGNFLSPKDFSAVSDTGRVRVPNTWEGGECRIETDTGDIRFE